MKPKLYLETSIISYLTARRSNDIITIGHQETTKKWWKPRRGGFVLIGSELVVQEAGLGNPEMAAKRLDILKGLTILAVSQQARELAKALVHVLVVLEKASADALHIAIAAVEKIDFLATWNFKHIANARMQDRIDDAVRREGFEPSKICTLEELFGE